MSLLLRATEMIGLPVVTIDDGEDVAEIKDVVYGSAEGSLLGFTLNRRGYLAGPLKRVLHWEDVSGLGRHALMIETTDRMRPARDDLAKLASQSDRAVLGTDVLADNGTRLGRVTDVVVLCGERPDIVGYEVQASDAMGPRAGKRVLIPLPDTLSVSGQALMVPAQAEAFVADDITGFGAAVEAFRAKLREAGTARSEPEDIA